MNLPAGRPVDQFAPTRASANMGGWGASPRCSFSTFPSVETQNLRSARRAGRDAVELAFQKRQCASYPLGPPRWPRSTKFRLCRGFSQANGRYPCQRRYVRKARLCRSSRVAEVVSPVRAMCGQNRYEMTRRAAPRAHLGRDQGTRPLPLVALDALDDLPQTVEPAQSTKEFR